MIANHFLCRINLQNTVAQILKANLENSHQQRYLLHFVLHSFIFPFIEPPHMPFLTSQTWWVGVLAVTVTLRMLPGLQPPYNCIRLFQSSFCSSLRVCPLVVYSVIFFYLFEKKNQSQTRNEIYIIFLTLQGCKQTSTYQGVKNHNSFA